MLFFSLGSLEDVQNTCSCKLNVPCLAAIQRFFNPNRSWIRLKSYPGSTFFLQEDTNKNHVDVYEKFLINFSLTLSNDD